MSTIPKERGYSGPTIVRSILLSKANFRRDSILSSLMSTLTPTEEVPPLPGAIYIFSTAIFFLTDNAIACSRPPPPIINTSIYKS